MGNSDKPHYIYEIVFPDGMIYVGCTVNLGNRIKQHYRKTTKAVKKHMDKTGYTLDDANFRVHQKVMYRSIGLCKERGRIKHLHGEGKCLNYRRRKKREKITDVEINGEMKSVLSDGSIIEKKEDK